MDECFHFLSIQDMTTQHTIVLFGERLKSFAYNITAGGN